MRGFFLGAVLFSLVVVSVLSLRPGGLRHQLSEMGRRLRLALILAGIYLVASLILRLALPSGTLDELLQAAVALVLAGVFLILGQVRQQA